MAECCLCGVFRRSATLPVFPDADACARPAARKRALRTQSHPGRSETCQVRRALLRRAGAGCDASTAADWKERSVIETHTCRRGRVYIAAAIRAQASAAIVCRPSPVRRLVAKLNVRVRGLGGRCRVVWQRHNSWHNRARPCSRLSPPPRRRSPCIVLAKYRASSPRHLGAAQVSVLWRPRIFCVDSCSCQRTHRTVSQLEQSVP